MKHGHLKLSRKMFDGSDLFWSEPRTFSRAEAWIDLLQMTAWRNETPYSTPHHGVDILARGEFVASLRYLAGRWQWNKNTVSRFIGLLEKAGRLKGQRVGQHGRVYLIVNYHSYQSGTADSGTAEGTEDGTQEGQGRDTSGTKKKQLSSKASLRGAARSPELVVDEPQEGQAWYGAAASPPTFKNWPADYGKAWESARRGTAPFGRIGKALARLIERDGAAAHYPAWLRFVLTEKAAYGPEYFASNLIEFSTTPRERAEIRTDGVAFSEIEWLVQSFELANRDRARIGSPLVRWEDVHPDLPCPPHLKAAHAA